MADIGGCRKEMWLDGWRRAELVRLNGVGCRDMQLSTVEGRDRGPQSLELFSVDPTNVINSPDKVSFTSN